MSAVAARGKATLTMRVLRKDGSVETVEVERDVVRDENGEVRLAENVDKEIEHG